MRQAIACLACILVYLAPVRADTISVPGDTSSLAEAVARARCGDIIALGKGQFAGGVTIDRPITIRGINWAQTRIAGEQKVLTIDADVTLENLAVVGGRCGVFVKAGNHLGAFGCAFTDAAEDGIGFEPSTATTIELCTCLVTRNVDGIDLESTQGLIMDTVFTGNADDGLDYDGDARVTCVHCRFADNGDDGIEVRLRNTTEVILSKCEFSGNKEDGLEIINSPLAEPACNVLVLGHNNFTGNRRWGVGFVTSSKPEEALKDDRTKAQVMWGPNAFEGNTRGAVSPNHAREMLRAQPTSAQTTITVTSADGNKSKRVVPMHTLLPVATISLRPDLGGQKIRDLEGVTLLGTRMFVADDDSPAIYEVDLTTKQISRKLKTNPIPGTDVTVKGTEGLSLTSIDGEAALLLSCDDERRVLTLDPGPHRFGALLGNVDVSKVTPQCEGIEQIGDKVLVVHSGRSLRILRPGDLEPTPQARLSFDTGGFGAHIAGIGYDGRRIIIAASAYQGKQVHTQYSSLIALDPDTCEPLEAWHMSYLDDPRGVACANGLVWVADGKSPYKDAELGIRTASGIRVLTFALEDNIRNSLRWHHMPGPGFRAD